MAIEHIIIRPHIIADVNSPKKYKGVFFSEMHCCNINMQMQVQISMSTFEDVNPACTNHSLNNKTNTFPLNTIHPYDYNSMHLLQFY